MSLNLEGSEDTLVTILPPNAEFVRLSNVLLSSIPSGLGDLAALQDLYVQCTLCILWQARPLPC
jgi:hypothetical protein